MEDRKRKITGLTGGIILEKKMDKEKIINPKIQTFGHGLLMGVADSVPGVSGGTIALIIGIYQKLITSLTIFINFFHIIERAYN